MKIKVLLLVISVAFACETDLDCNLGGRCNENTKSCECSKEWKGDDCSLLDLLPAELDNGYNQDFLNVKIKHFFHIDFDGR